MEWLDNARGSQLTGSLKDIADKVSPVLSRGAVAEKGERSADLLAHMGWATSCGRAKEQEGLIQRRTIAARSKSIPATFSRTPCGVSIS